MELIARASYDTDWHVYLDHPKRGPLGYCTGVGPEEDFAPEAATLVLAAGGWRVTSPWTQTPPEAEYPYTATVVSVDDQSADS